jgi:PIN domain nuclease of toxin-antitoxin system
VTGLAVTDTHGLLWFGAGNHQRLGRQALRFFQRVDAAQAVVYVPTIVLVEVCELAHLGRISLEGAFGDWELRLFESGNYVAVDLTREVVRVSESLFTIRERSDRLIAATAVHLGIPLITRDPDIGQAAGVDVIW